MAAVDIRVGVAESEIFVVRIVEHLSVLWIERCKDEYIDEKDADMMWHRSLKWKSYLLQCPRPVVEHVHGCAKTRATT